MILSLSEQERTAYIAGDVGLASKIDNLMVLCNEVGVLLGQVEEDVPNTRAHRHLFDQVEAVQNVLNEVDV